ncbi:sporulation integral membrane protein YtvI [Aminipila luticellarii]|uniref:Sporulation integral membrane protein YtvI n=1 Tax=Aminipila luticellarii TaxID=2507160 RepID=A0A410PXF4_9FIRM|nr:sporulation integral membrane protein YtvI [Aminipila luticellarii]QAT43628.1 sporulation integral membrane protein YtvI [Aminipila luticellarii]
MESQYSKKKSFIVNAVYALLIVLIVYVSLKYLFNLVSPFLFAFIFAFLLQKPSRRISAFTKIPTKWVSLVLVFVFYSTIGVLIALLGVKLIATVTALISQLPILYENQLEPFLLNSFHGIEDALDALSPTFIDKFNADFDQFVNSLGANVTEMSLSLIGMISNIASSLPGFFIKILIMIISTFFIAMDYNILVRFTLRQFSPKGREIILSIKKYIVNTLFVVIRSYAIIMSITFIELSIGLSLIQMNNAIIIALTIALFDILPVLGTGGIMIPWVLINLLQRDYQTAVSLLVLYLFITVIRNIIEPKIVGSQLGLHPVVTLFCIFLGANLFGVIGVFGFPIALSLLKHLNDAGTINVFK